MSPKAFRGFCTAQEDSLPTVLLPRCNLLIFRVKEQWFPQPEGVGRLALPVLNGYRMKTTWLLVIGIATFCAALPQVRAANGKPVTRRGTSVLHYTTQNDLAATENGSNVVGSLRLEYKEQGHSQKQSLRLYASGLETNSAYGLIAVIGDDTNAVPVADLNADGKGRLRVSYRSKGQGNVGKNPLPDALLPLTDVRSIGIENTSTQTVAYAWIADAHRFQYIVKRNLTPEDTNGLAAGSISLIANHRRVHFRLLAGGLNATNDYHLALNSDILSTLSTDANGRVELRGWPTNAPAVLDLRSLSILDGSSNVVLSTTFPR